MNKMTRRYLLLGNGMQKILGSPYEDAISNCLDYGMMRIAEKHFELLNQKN